MAKMSYLSGRVQDFLAEYVRGKAVLDVGCVDHSASLEGQDFWLHKHIARSARQTVGLDILESEAEKLREAGYDVVCGDACTISVGQTFDVVVAGEIIEHVDNPGAFVRNMARHHNNGGRLVITTPHPFFLLHVLESIFSSPERRWNAEHTSWYEPFTLENLLRRNNLEIEAAYYFTRSRKLLRLMKLLRFPSYGPISSSILVIAKPAEAQTRATA